MSKTGRSEDLQKFWSDSNQLRKRGRLGSVRPGDIFVEAAKHFGNTNAGTARRDARLFQSAHNSKSSTYKLPGYVKQFLSHRISELASPQPKGKSMHDTREVTNVPRILRGNAPAADLR